MNMAWSAGVVGSITVGKDECHVVDLLHRKDIVLRHEGIRTPVGVRVHCGPFGEAKNASFVGDDPRMRRDRQNHGRDSNGRDQRYWYYRAYLGP
jgi:hypothetical protein